MSSGERGGGGGDVNFLARKHKLTVSCKNNIEESLPNLWGVEIHKAFVALAYNKNVGHTKGAVNCRSKMQNLKDVAVNFFCL